MRVYDEVVDLASDRANNNPSTLEDSPSKLNQVASNDYQYRSDVNNDQSDEDPLHYIAEWPFVNFVREE